MADPFKVSEHQFFVPMTQYVRPNGRQIDVTFPVIDQETVDRVTECNKAEFTYACECLSGDMWAFYIVDEVAGYDVVTKVFDNVLGDSGDTNRKNVSDMIKSNSVEHLLQRREHYIAQENSND